MYASFFSAVFIRKLNKLRFRKPVSTWPQWIGKSERCASALPRYARERSSARGELLADLGLNRAATTRVQGKSKLIRFDQPPFPSRVPVAYSVAPRHSDCCRRSGLSGRSAMRVPLAYNRMTGTLTTLAN
jgi:hypothetical protein